MRVCGWYICPLNAHAGSLFFSKKHDFLGLTPVYSETATKTQKVASAGYYGIEDPFPDLISKLRRFRGIRSADCWLSRAIGSQNAVILMLRRLLLL